MEYYLAVKINEVLGHATAWMKCEDIMLRKRNPSCMLSNSILCERNKRGKSSEMGGRLALARAGDCWEDWRD